MNVLFIVVKWNLPLLHKYWCFSLCVCRHDCREPRLGWRRVCMFSCLYTILWTVCRWPHLSVCPLPHQEEDFDDDYESPYSGDDAESVEDYELPNEAANDYEPPPSQPSDDLKVCPSLPIGDNDYIGNHNLFYHNCYFTDRFNGFLGVSIHAMLLSAFSTLGTKIGLCVSIYCILKVRFLCAL